MKRLFDIVVGLTLLILASPILIVFCILIWLQDYHSPFYMAPRVGRGERLFTMVKLRSMIVNADKSGVDSTAVDDKRITRVGELIRKFKLDELTQLINVVKGDMSVVGPRPNVKRETDLYTAEEKRLLSVRPGITDPASIVFSDEGDILEGSADPDLDYNQLIRPGKGHLSLFYIDRRSSTRDIRIMWLTATAILDRRRALAGVVDMLKALDAPELLVEMARRERPLTPTPPPGATHVVADRLSSRPKPEESLPMTVPDFTDVTEMAGEEISPEQLFRLANRYYWAGDYADGKDVIEVACGTGPGLDYLARRGKSLRAGDFSQAMVDQVIAHYGDRVDCRRFDAQTMPFDDNSADLILIFEALYYIPSAETFLAECKRVLRPGGYVLVSSANPDLFDFNPSPHSFTYHGVTGLAELFGDAGFETILLGATPLAEVGLKQKILRPVKKFVVASGLMPRSMTGKRLLKRLVFGDPVLMPAEITEGMADVEDPTPLPADHPDTGHKVIYCAARLPETAD